MYIPLMSVSAAAALILIAIVLRCCASFFSSFSELVIVPCGLLALFFAMSPLASPGKHCGPAALGLSGARRQLGGGRPRGEGRGRSARGARPPGRGPGYAQALDEILPTNKSDLCQLAATQTAGLVVGNLRSSACAALRAARVAMMALIISFACHTVWH